MVSEARDTVGEMKGKCGNGWERIEGAREKKIGALGSPDRNKCPNEAMTLRSKPPGMWCPPGSGALSSDGGDEES